MLRVANLENSVRFYRDGLGFKEVSRREYPQGKFTLVFLQSEADAPNGSLLELTFNWETSAYDRGNGYGHLAYQVDSIQALQTRLRSHGYDLSWGPGKTPDGRKTMAFVDDPDGYEIELLEPTQD